MLGHKITFFKSVSLCWAILLTQIWSKTCDREQLPDFLPDQVSFVYSLWHLWVRYNFSSCICPKIRKSAKALHWLLCLISWDVTLCPYLSQAHPCAPAMHRPSANKCRTVGSVTWSLRLLCVQGYAWWEVPINSRTQLALARCWNTTGAQPVLEVVQGHTGLAAWVYNHMQHASVKSLVLGGVLLRLRLFLLLTSPCRVPWWEFLWV